MGFSIYNSPFRELGTMAEQMNKFFKTFEGNEDSPERQRIDFRPLVDIIENEQSVIFEVELPGVDKNDVKVSFAEGVLTIKGEKKMETPDEKNVCCRSERVYGSFFRSFMLPENTNPDAISATFEKGVLYLTAPKVEPEKPKQVEVEIK